MKHAWHILLRSLLIAAGLGLLSVVVVAAQATGAASPTEAVRVLVRSLVTAEAPQAGCNTLTGQVADCPVTERLRARLQSPIPGVETGNLISRSQNPPRAVEVAAVKLAEDATEAQINTRWQYGTSQNQFEYIITFVVRKEAGGWLVDDSYCVDNPGTSIHNPPVGPCPVVAVGEVPGMPTTGAGPGWDYLLPLVLAVVGVGLGILLARRGKRQAG
jgi:hypothetical protein